MASILEDASFPSPQVNPLANLTCLEYMREPRLLDDINETTKSTESTESNDSLYDKESSSESEPENQPVVDTNETDVYCLSENDVIIGYSPSLQSLINRINLIKVKLFIRARIANETYETSVHRDSNGDTTYTIWTRNTNWLINYSRIVSKLKITKVSLL
jgi:hypothetical protein